MREIQTGISAPRGKRGRDGKYRDEEGRVSSQPLEVKVRGRRLQVLSDVRKALVNLTESAETMGWFLAHLWHDLRPAIIQDHGDQPADDPPAPGDDDPTAPGERSDAPVDKDGSIAKVNAALEEALVKFRAHGAIRRANVDKINGRFKILAHGPGASPRYHHIKN